MNLSFSNFSLKPKPGQCSEPSLLRTNSASKLLRNIHAHKPITAHLINYKVLKRPNHPITTLKKASQNYEFECYNYPRPSTQNNVFNRRLPVSFMYKSHTQWARTMQQIQYNEDEGCVKALDMWEKIVLPEKLRLHKLNRK